MIGVSVEIYQLPHLLKLQLCNEKRLQSKKNHCRAKPCQEQTHLEEVGMDFETRNITQVTISAG